MKTKSQQLIPFLLLASILPLSAADTDNDGAPDGYEIATGFDPRSSDSTPPAGPAIGLNFRRNTDPESIVSWPSDNYNGYIPQINWNQVVAQGNENSLSHARIQSPVTGQVTDGAGSPTSLTFSATGFAFTSWNNLTGGPSEKLNAGYLLRRGGEIQIQFNQVPYSSYDIYVYMSGPSNLGINTVTINKDSPSEQQITVRPTDALRPNGFYPVRRVEEGVRQFANVLIFRHFNTSSFTLHANDDYAGVGVAGVQIVDRTADTDTDGIPDWWELLHKTDAKTANADIDPDSDEVNNLHEYLRFTDPANPDSDNDGLSDAVETNTGVFVDASNTGTDPNYADSDGDRLSDYDEINSLTPSDPNKADSDGDLIDDRVERRNRTSPQNASFNDIPLPGVSNASQFQWHIQNLQIEWNHNLPKYENDWLFRIPLENIDRDYWPRTLNPSIQFGLRNQEDKVVYWFQSHRRGETWGPANGLWINVWGNEDLISALGFSGRGTRDFSDVITLSVTADRNTDGSWALRVSGRNESTGQVIFSHEMPDATAGDSLNAGTAIWRVKSESQEFGQIIHSPGIKIHRTATRLDLSPFYADQLDDNNDGIADSWATLYSISDPDSDTDNDGLTAFEEFVAGTNPVLHDSDSDGVPDGQEIRFFGDPNDPLVQPAFIGQAVPDDGDLNQNGLPDLWESKFSRGGTLEAAADPDGDGFGNLEESIAGTDPFDSHSYLSLKSETVGEGIRLFWESPVGKRVRLKRSLSDFEGFDILPGVRSGTTLPAEPGAAFFQLSVTDVDTDNDGLTDSEELLLGTSPTEAHSISRSLPHNINEQGATNSNLSGDYAYFLKRFQDSSTGSSSSTLTDVETSRFLMQATYGPTTSDISELQRMGIESWIDDQIHNQPVSSYRQIIDEFWEDQNGPHLHDGLFITPRRSNNTVLLDASNINTAFAECAIRGKDQLRQRVALALTQYFVISRAGTNGVASPRMVSQYYDLLAEGAFGNFYDLLKKITRSNQMARYLTLINNQKADPSISRFPDENYAREVMQLFTIGIHELNTDGSLKRDENGFLIETYDTFDVTEMARVMTGLVRPFQSADDPFATGNLFLPLVMKPDRHDFGEKQILKRHTIPAREATIENGDQDIDDALLVLFNHENTPPFFSRSMIQFLVTDNPSPEYIERVASAFIDDGNGVRGNLGAVFKAILMDPEARDISLADSRAEFGRLRDPLVRMMHLCRVLQMGRNRTVYWWSVGTQRIERTGQELFASPTVFNFYNPEYKPNGPLLESDLVGAPFEIMDSITAVTFPNYLWEIITEGFQQPRRTVNAGFDIKPYYDEFMSSASESNEALADHISLLLCGGRMKLATRSLLLEAFDQPLFSNGENLQEKIQIGLYLAAISPEGSISR